MHLTDDEIKEIADWFSTLPNSVQVTQFARAIESALSAQADARPVAWYDRATGNVYPLLGEGERYAAGVRQLEPLYTHPEASAPGLSREDSDLLRELLYRVEYDPGSPTEEKVHKALVALDGLRTQTTARPAFYAADDLELPIKNNNGGGRIFVSNEPFAGCSQAFYTHPEASAQPMCVKCGDGIMAHDPGTCGNCHAMGAEASAPGLSDEAAHLYHEALRISREHGFATLNDALDAAILASAATVAEPVDRYRAGFKQGYSEGYVEGKIDKAAQQQAEPGADEQPVAYQYEIATAIQHGGHYSHWEERITKGKPNTPEGGVRNLRPLYARAPQSGQRAGVAEDAIEAAAKKLAEDFDYPWEQMPAQGKDDFRAKVRSIAAMLTAATEAK